MFFYITQKNILAGIPRFPDFSFFLSCTFNYELILVKIDMNANNMKTQISCIVIYDLRGH